MSRGRGGRGRGGRGRGGQGNRGRSSGRSGAGRGGSKGKGKGKGKSSSSRGRRGGQGNRGRTSTSRNAASNKGNRGGYGKKGASTGRKGGQGNRNTKPGRAQGSITRKSLTKAVKSIGKALSGASARASTLGKANTKQQSKLQRQISNFKKRWQAMSTPEAKRARIRKRLRERHGLDYDRMNKSFAVDVNVDRAMRHYKVPKSIRNMVPGPIKNIKFKKQFYSPTKLGAADGWGRKTGGYNKSNPSKLRSLLAANQAANQEDWLADLYSSHNINQGNLDQASRDYWTNEATTRGRDAVMQSIIDTSKAEGTYGRKKPLTSKPMTKDLLRTSLAAAIAARGM